MGISASKTDNQPEANEEQPEPLETRNEASLRLVGVLG